MPHAGRDGWRLSGQQWKPGGDICPTVPAGSLPLALANVGLTVSDGRHFTACRSPLPCLTSVALTAAAMPPAAAMWLSLIMTMSNRPAKTRMRQKVMV